MLNDYLSEQFIVNGFRFVFLLLVNAFKYLIFIVLHLSVNKYKFVVKNFAFMLIYKFCIMIFFLFFKQNDLFVLFHTIYLSIKSQFGSLNLSKTFSIVTLSNLFVTKKY